MNFKITHFLVICSVQKNETCSKIAGLCPQQGMYVREIKIKQRHVQYIIISRSGISVPYICFLKMALTVGEKCFLNYKFNGSDLQVYITLTGGHLLGRDCKNAIDICLIGKVFNMHAQICTLANNLDPNCSAGGCLEPKLIHSCCATNDHCFLLIVGVYVCVCNCYL